MKNLAIIVAMILFSSCVTARDLESSSSLGDEKLQWWNYHYHYPYFHPKPHWPSPATGKALPPVPSWFHPSPVVTKCMSDCKDVRTCFADIAKAYFTRKPSIGSDCCASIKKMNEDCEKTVFGSYHNPFFNVFVKLHCSTKDGSTPCSPPSA